MKSLEIKRCPKCRLSKTLSEFNNDSSSYRKDGKYSYCKSCVSILRNTDEERKRLREYAKQVRDNDPILRARRVVEERIRRYKRLYGISVEEYDKMLEFQDGKCAICHKPPKNKRLAVDHDHKTGIIRGLLCSMCNQSLHGRITQDWLFDAYEYLHLTPAAIALGRTAIGRLGRVNKRGKRKPR